MTHDDADQPAPPPSPADEAAVRRLLADARETGPVPPEVAARLDARLADLVAEREPPADVVPLAARRRRRAGALLLAAAAVVVGGVALGQYSPSGDGDSSGADTAADSAVDRTDQGAGRAEAPEAGAFDEATPGNSDGLTLRKTGETAARVRPDHFAADVKALRRSHQLAASLDDSALAVPRDFHCKRADFGPGLLVGVRYGDQPAVVAYRPPTGDTQVVEALQCGTGDVLRSTTVPAAK